MRMLIFLFYQAVDSIEFSLNFCQAFRGHCFSVSSAYKAFTVLSDFPHVCANSGQSGTWGMVCLTVQFSKAVIAAKGQIHVGAVWRCHREFIRLHGVSWAPPFLQSLQGCLLLWTSPFGAPARKLGLYLPGSEVQFLGLPTSGAKQQKNREWKKQWGLLYPLRSTATQSSRVLWPHCASSPATTRLLGTGLARAGVSVQRPPPFSLSIRAPSPALGAGTLSMPLSSVRFMLHWVRTGKNGKLSTSLVVLWIPGFIPSSPVIVYVSEFSNRCSMPSGQVLQLHWVGETGRIECLFLRNHFLFLLKCMCLVHPDSVILLSTKRKWATRPWQGMEEPYMHF